MSNLGSSYSNVQDKTPILPPSIDRFRDRGISCLKQGCVKCCLETRMPLSDLDLKRILKLGHRLEHFAVKTEEGSRLKNSSGRCVFLQQEGCEIYPHRPEGCKLYPIIYNKDMNAALDDDCPHRDKFEISKTTIQKISDLVSKLEYERDQRKQSTIIS